MAQLVSIDVAAKFEALQNEVDLVKNEIKQTLVDLREFLMKNRTIFPQAHAPMPPATLQTLAVEMTGDMTPGPTPDASAITGGLTSLQAHQTSGQSATFLDTEMLGKFIDWLGSVKRLGVSLHQITPYVEAYEASGYLHPLMVKVILRSMADLDQLKAIPHEQEFSTEDYAQCVGQLHQIICPSQNGTGGYLPSYAHPLEKSGDNLGDSAQVDGGELQGKAGIHQEQPEPNVAEALNTGG